MTGAGYVAICVSFGLAAGIVGKLKGSIFWVWFLVGGLAPFLGLLAALLYRFERDEPDMACPRCGRRCKAYDAVCMRCGYELEFDAPEHVDEPPDAGSASGAVTSGP